MIVEKKLRGKLLSGSSLKLVAIISMFIDHLGLIVLKNGIAMNAPYQEFSDSQFRMLLDMIDVCHIIGRLAFPLFCFLIVEGFLNTHDIKKYCIRIGVFALVSEPIYDLANTGEFFSAGQQNVMFTLLLGLLALYCMQKAKNNFFAVVTLAVGFGVLSFLLKTDGWYYGIALITIFYIFHDNVLLKLFFAAVTMYICGLDFSVKAILNPYFIVALCSLAFIALYSGKRGMKTKYFFYGFYPGHLIILYGIMFLLITLCY